MFTTIYRHTALRGVRHGTNAATSNRLIK